MPFLLAWVQGCPAFDRVDDMDIAAHPVPMAAQQELQGVSAGSGASVAEVDMLRVVVAVVEAENADSAEPVDLADTPQAADIVLVALAAPVADWGREDIDRVCALPVVARL